MSVLLRGMLGFSESLVSVCRVKYPGGLSAIVPEELAPTYTCLSPDSILLASFDVRLSNTLQHLNILHVCLTDTWTSVCLLSLCQLVGHLAYLNISLLAFSVFIC